jgi:hypothetical protein
MMDFVRQDEILIDPASFETQHSIPPISAKARKWVGHGAVLLMGRTYKR